MIATTLGFCQYVCSVEGTEMTLDALTGKTFWVTRMNVEPAGEITLEQLRTATTLAGK